MHTEIVLILFLTNFSSILTQNVVNKNLLFETSKQTTDINNGDIDDPPSPEWIKYQQERYGNLDKSSSQYLDMMKRTQQQVKNSAFSKAESNKMATSNRQESAEQDEEQQRNNFENNNSKHSEESTADKNTSTVEFPSIKGFIEFIKSVKQNWFKKSMMRFDDKIKMLYKLKDALLKTIEKQFMILWQDDEDDEGDEDDENDMIATESLEPKEMRENKRSQHLRRKRGILGESSINFPPDAALMSINFLTFAVFLIKLVLQVVNIVKTKHYQVSPMDTGAIRN